MRIAQIGIGETTLPGGRGGPPSRQIQVKGIFPRIVAVEQAANAIEDETLPSIKAVGIHEAGVAPGGQPLHLEPADVVDHVGQELSAQAGPAQVPANVHGLELGVIGPKQEGRRSAKLPPFFQNPKFAASGSEVFARVDEMRLIRLDVEQKAVLAINGADQAENFGKIVGAERADSIHGPMRVGAPRLEPGATEVAKKAAAEKRSKRDRRDSNPQPPA